VPHKSSPAAACCRVHADATRAADVRLVRDRSGGRGRLQRPKYAMMSRRSVFRKRRIAASGGHADSGRVLRIARIRPFLMNASSGVVVAVLNK